LSVVVRSRWRTTCSPVRSGYRDHTRAAAPETIAVEALVPVPEPYPPDRNGDTISSPGAVNQMYPAPAVRPKASSSSGGGAARPLTDTSATRPSDRTAPTATDPGVAVGYSVSGALPPATTTIFPASRMGLI